MTAGEEAGLLEAIITTPDDDGPRLVYADWLQSKSDPRGEFIQLQCQLAATPPDGDQRLPDRRRAMRIAENKLLEAHEATWTDPLRALLPVPGWADQYKFEFVRGFVERVQVTLLCVSAFDALFAAAPLLREMTIFGSSFDGSKWTRPNTDELFASPHLAKLRAIDIGLGGGGNELAFAIADCAALANLETLGVHGSVWGEAAAMFDGPREKLLLDDDGVTAIARAKHLANVKVLNIEGNRCTSIGLRAIGEGAWRLRSLDLARNMLDGDVAAALAGPAFENLEHLRLAQMELPTDGTFGVSNGPAMIVALVKSKQLGKLVELDLESCKLGAPIAVAMVAAVADYRPVRANAGKMSSAPATRTLRLVKNPKIIDAIHRWRADATLVSFKLGGPDVSDAALVAKAERQLERTGSVAVVANRWPTAARHRAWVVTEDTSRVVVGRDAIAKAVVDLVRRA